MAKEKSKSFSYWWIIIFIIILGVWFYVKSQPDKEITFVVKSGQTWHSCYNDSSNITIEYDLSSSSAVDLIFTPTKEDYENYLLESLGLSNLSEAKYYPSCYLHNILKNKGSCILAGEGCIILYNIYTNDATISLKYSARKIEG